MGMNAETQRRRGEGVECDVEEGEGRGWGCNRNEGGWVRDRVGLSWNAVHHHVKKIRREQRMSKPNPPVSPRAFAFNRITKTGPNKPRGAGPYRSGIAVLDDGLEV